MSKNNVKYAIPFSLNLSDAIFVIIDWIINLRAKRYNKMYESGNKIDKTIKEL